MGLEPRGSPGIFTLGRWSQAYFLTCVYRTDEATLALMKTPRCSLPDLPPGAQSRRKRQIPPPTKWSKRNLSWRCVARVGTPQVSMSLNFCHPWGQTRSARIPPLCRLEGGECITQAIWKADTCLLLLASYAFISWRLGKGRQEGTLISRRGNTSPPWEVQKGLRDSWPPL